MWCGEGRIAFVLDGQSGRGGGDSRSLLRVSTVRTCYSPLPKNKNKKRRRFFLSFVLAISFFLSLFHRVVSFVLCPSSVLDTYKDIHSTYDLKGSSLGRSAKPGEKVLKDNDLAGKQGKLHLGSQREAFLKVGGMNGTGGGRWRLYSAVGVVRLGDVYSAVGGGLFSHASTVR